MRGRKREEAEADTKNHFLIETDPALQEGPVEDHFILRLPLQVANQLRPKVKGRDLPVDMSLSFKDQRHGKLTLNNKTFNTTLVDLPTITESLKTLDNKQFYKIADISQLLICHEKTVLTKDFNWPHGLSPALDDVRNKRFRKRMDKKVVEDVEQEVERLLSADYASEQITYEVLERKENEQSEEEESEEDEMQPDDDLDLDAAIDDAMEKPDENESEDDESAEESEEEVEEDPDEKNEENVLKIAANALRHEISALEVKLVEKRGLASNQVNAIMKERFKGIVEKLANELYLKREQLESLEEDIRNEDE